MFDRIKTYVVKKCENSVMGVIFKGDKAAIETERDVQFESAKRLSDFVGMIIRFAFANFATLYLLTKATTVPGVSGWALAVSGGFAAAITVVFGIKLYIIILLNEARGVAAFSSKWAKIISIVLTLITVGLLQYGITDLVKSLPNPVGRASPNTPAPA